MHDSGIEDRLRTVLRSEGDALPVTITAAELERRLAARRRQRSGRRLSLVAAAIAIVAIGSMAAMANGLINLPSVGGPPSVPPASATARPSSSLLDTLPDLQPTQPDDVSTSTRYSGDVDRLQPNDPSPTVNALGTDPLDGQYAITVVCAGPEPVELRIGTAVDLGQLSPPVIACDATPMTVAYDTADHPGADTQLVLVAPRQDAWKVLVESIKRPVARAPIGRSDDAVVVTPVVSDAGIETGLKVSLVHEDLTTTTVATIDEAAFGPGLRVSEDRAPTISSTGYLLVSLADGEGNSAGAALFDLHDPTADPLFFSDPSIVAFAWGPTGLLAADYTDKVTISDPAEPGAAPQVIALASNMSLTTMPYGRGLAWSADGRGLLADRATGDAFERGVIGLDGNFTVDPTPATFAPTGLQRDRDVSGHFLSDGCDQNGQGASDCFLTSDLPDGGGRTLWFTDGSDGGSSAADQIWAADGATIWLLVDRQKAGATTPSAVLRTGGPTTYADVATIQTVAGSTPRIVGLTPDDARIAIELGDGRLVLVNRLTGEQAPFQGRMVGWGDSTGFRYPNPEAP